MAKNVAKEAENIEVFGAEDTAGVVIEDTENTPSDAPQGTIDDVEFEDEPAPEAPAEPAEDETEEPAPETPAEGDSEDETETPAEGDSEDEAESEIEMGEAQASNMQITTTVSTGKIPQVDTSKFENRIRHIMNGDIQDEEGVSEVADKMVNEAKGFQLSKSCVKSFPETGADYLKTLDFQVNA